MNFRLLRCRVATAWLVMAGLALAAEGAKTTATKPKDKPFFRKPFLLGAHRAGAALWPESTLVAFKAAAKRWPDMLLETDARLTADGRVVLLHDETVDRTTDGTGLIAELTLAEVKKLDAGYRFTPDGGKTFPYRGKGVRIALLSEVLAALPDSRFEVELKPADGIVEPTIRVIKHAKAEDRVLLASFSSRLMLRARKLAPRTPSCYEYMGGLAMLGKLRSGGEAWAAYRPTADVLSLTRRMLKRFELTPEEIRAIQAKGVYFQIHTPNTRQSILTALELNPDSLLTDRPDLLADVIAERARSK